MQIFLLQAVNKQLNKGFVIPVVDGITFINPQVSYGPGYLVIDTDVSYKPSMAAIEEAISAEGLDGHGWM